MLLPRTHESPSTFFYEICAFPHRCEGPSRYILMISDQVGYLVMVTRAVTDGFCKESTMNKNNNNGHNDKAKEAVKPILDPNTDNKGKDQKAAVKPDAGKGAHQWDNKKK